MPGLGRSFKETKRGFPMEHPSEERFHSKLILSLAHFRQVGAKDIRCAYLEYIQVPSMCSLTCLIVASYVSIPYEESHNLSSLVPHITRYV